MVSLTSDEQTRQRFLVKMVSDNVPETVGADIISVAELTQKLFADAKAVGISRAEIEEATVSAYNTILDASPLRSRLG